MWWLLDPVIGNALRTVGDSDRAALAESEGLERAPHRSVVLVSVATQVVSVLSCEAEDRPSNTASAHRRHTVNHVIIGIRTPRAVNVGVRLVRTWREGEDGERSILVGDEETVLARDVCLRIDSAWVSFGPLSRIPVRLHERAGVLIRVLNELEVFRGLDSNLHMNTMLQFRHIEVFSELGVEAAMLRAQF